MRSPGPPGQRPACYLWRSPGRPSQTGAPLRAQSALGAAPRAPRMRQIASGAPPRALPAPGAALVCAAARSPCALTRSGPRVAQARPTVRCRRLGPVGRHAHLHHWQVRLGTAGPTSCEGGNSQPIKARRQGTRQDSTRPAGQVSKDTRQEHFSCSRGPKLPAASRRGGRASSRGGGFQIRTGARQLALLRLRYFAAVPTPEPWAQVFDLSF